MYQNNPYANNYGYTYGVPRPQARNTQPLTPEQISKLRNDSTGFDMKVEQEDLWRAACTHKEKSGQSTLIANDDGTYTCTICHKTFNMCDCTREEVEKSVKLLTDLLQTCKTVYLDAPEELIRQYWQILPLLEKFPALWDRAMKNFSMYEGTAITGVNTMYPGYSGFTALNALMNNPYAAYGYNNGYPYNAPQNMYGYQPNNGFYPAPQQAAPVYGAPMVDPTGNPMAYGAPTNIPAPTAPAPAAAPAPGFIPGAPQAAPAAAPVAAPATSEVQQQQVFNV